MAEVMRRLIELEADVRYQEVPAPGELAWGITCGRIPILLSAPHAAAHIRDGRLKEEDEYTAGFVRLVADLSGAYAMYARRQSTEDPNWSGDSAYKRELGRLVQEHGLRFVLDVHGADTHTDFGVALGTIHGESCPMQFDLILDTLQHYGLRRDAEGLNRLDVDDAYSARGAGTITRFASQTLGVPAAQFEINGHLRIVERRDDATKKRGFYGDPWRIENCVRAFVSLVRDLNTSVTHGGMATGLDEPERSFPTGPSAPPACSGG